MDKKINEYQEHLKKEITRRMDAAKTLEEAERVIDDVLDAEFKKLGIRDVKFDLETMTISYNNEH